MYAEGQVAEQQLSVESSEESKQSVLNVPAAASPEQYSVLNVAAAASTGQHSSVVNIAAAASTGQHSSVLNVAAAASNEQHSLHNEPTDSTGHTLSAANSEVSEHSILNEDSSGDSANQFFIPEIRIGLEFPSKEAAFEYYKMHSYLNGFGVYSNGGSSADGKKQRVIFRCHKARPSRAGKVKPVPEKKRVQEKTNCLASLTVSYNTSKEVWFISSFNTEHNHLLTPEFSHKMKSHRSIELYVKRQLEINENAGLSAIANIKVAMQMAGGVDVCRFIERDARNFIGKLRRSGLKNGDAEAMMDFFRQAKADDPDFYYACKFSPENCLEIVFWADSVAHAAYRYFGDAVSFDATYIVNKYDLPVAPIVGINHHYQTIVFGCSMMTTEDGDSYKWILQSFLDCMGGKAPSAIVTDQSLAMKVAIQNVLPNTIHRYCIWHIMSKLSEKIGNNKDKKEIKKGIRSAVWDSTTEEQFESKWQSTVTLQDNVWLTDMFEMRSKWVPAYLSKFFWAGMSSTQRSESMNAFLDMFVNSKTCLSDVWTFSSFLEERSGFLKNGNKS
ncbi:hypothetical protein LUZ61_006986 [Rhynchospora tenuis]|uniref:Protein FAR1-RELATED SEQUENCE n=1 Tax=Rhynchospora tenuis TaxID=198213 RepID=A0AAD5ZSN3_9POAL|nr:hypothetical protein LUZ61_006986 [Rhynchospora tenuis]